MSMFLVRVHARTITFCECTSFAPEKPINTLVLHSINTIHQQPLSQGEALPVFLSISTLLSRTLPPRRIHHTIVTSVVTPPKAAALSLVLRTGSSRFHNFRDNYCRYDSVKNLATEANNSTRRTEWWLQIPRRRRRRETASSA